MFSLLLVPQHIYTLFCEVVCSYKLCGTPMTSLISLISEHNKMHVSHVCMHTASLVPRPHPAFHYLQYQNSDGKLGEAWERG